MTVRWQSRLLVFVATTTTAYAQLAPNPSYDGRIVFARLRYDPISSPSGCQASDSPAGPGWGHDYPASVQGLMKAATELTSIAGPVDTTTTLTVGDPQFMKYPIAMLTEPGCWNPTDTEAKALREYLLKGGFLVVDDPTFSDATPEHMDLAVELFEDWMRRVLPDGRLVRIPDSDPIFEGFFTVRPQGMIDENDGAVAEIRGIYQDNDPAKRLMVIANYRAAIGQFWRYASNDIGSGLGGGSAGMAYRLGLNYLIYGLSH